MFSKVFVAAIVAAAANALGDFSDAFEFEDVMFNMRVVDDGQCVEFTVCMPEVSWFGLVLGQGDMSKGGDIIVFHANKGESYVSDNTAIGYGPPTEDEMTNIKLVDNIPMQKMGHVTLVAKRKLNTGDEADFVVPLDEEFTLGMAFNPETSDVNYASKHVDASSRSVYLYSDGEPSIGGWKWDEPAEGDFSFMNAFDDMIGSGASALLATGLSVGTAVVALM